VARCDPPRRIEREREIEREERGRERANLESLGARHGQQERNRTAKSGIKDKFSG
jgi:hypothetical protein